MTPIGTTGRNDRAAHVLAALAGLAALLPLATHAATKSGILQPSVTIAAICSVSTTALDFGNVTNVNGNKNATATITITCANGVSYTVGLGAGTYGGGTVTTRRMKKVIGTQTVNYGIYKNAAHTIVWGNAGADLVSGTGNGAAQALTARGQIPGGQGPKPLGGYTDTVQVIVTY